MELDWNALRVCRAINSDGAEQNCSQRLGGFLWRRASNDMLEVQMYGHAGACRALEDVAKPGLCPEFDTVNTELKQNLHRTTYYKRVELLLK